MLKYRKYSNNFLIIMRKLLFFITIISVSACFVSCSKNRNVSSVEKKEVFPLSYGNFEDQLNLFSLSGVGDVNTYVVMRDGFFYIMNGEARKIMEMNSFGELVSLYYNPEFNPSLSSANDSRAKESTRKTIEYAFNDLSAITVDSRKYLYVVDKLPLERQEQDKDSSLVLTQIVLRFDSNGNFVDYIGQQGPGGTPFPYIKSLYTTTNNELVVVSYSTDGYIVYWFSTNGFLMYQIVINSDNIVNPYKDTGKDVWSNITSIVPDYSNRTLYLDVDFYSTYIDKASRLQSGVDYDSSHIYPLDVETGKYGKAIEVLPNSDLASDSYSNEHYEIPYDFLGVTENGWLFFMVSTENGFDIQMIQEDGQKILCRHIPVNRKELLYYTFDLNSSGILTGLFIKNEGAQVVWWRTDSLIQSVINN